jgi:hypothetical protein
VHIYGCTTSLWEQKCDAFIRQEVELRQKNPRVVKETIFYSEPASDQYKIFWVEFLEELFQWLDQLQEAPEYKDQVKKTYNWTFASLVALHRLDH